MKNLLALLFLISFKANAQKDKTITNAAATKVITTPINVLISPSPLAGYEDFYIIFKNKIFAKHSTSKEVISVDDINNANTIRWQVLKNADGTLTICNKLDYTKKLIEFSDWATILAQGTSIRNTGSAGTTTATAANTKALFLDTSNSITARNLVNRWYLRKISNELHWLIYPNKLDSFQIRLLPKSLVPLNNINWAFTDLNGWDIQGALSGNNAFVGQPSRINKIPFYSSAVVPQMPLGGSYWQGIEEKFFSFSTRTTASLINTSRPGDNKWAPINNALTGVLLSKPFIVSKTNINFKIAGTENLANNKVEVFIKLIDSEPGAITFDDGLYKLVNTFTGHNNDISRQVSIALPDAFKIYRIRVTDNVTDGHLLLADFTFDDRAANQPAPAAPIIPANKPLWGAIDMHTHPMAYMGMGGKLMHGKLDGDPNIALGNCNEIHGGFGLTDNPKGNFLRAEFVNLLDEHNQKEAGGSQVQYKLEDGKIPHHDHPHEGFPALVNWPTQKSMIHQQMWYEWLERASKGGLKAIIALTINSELLSIVLEGDTPSDDKTTADNQIAEIKAFADRHPSMFGIATNPSQMRDVINSGRMAIIIGMEIDNIGNFYANTNVTTDQIIAEISRLKSLGVSYIFPIHVVDNNFGGSAAYKDFFNFSNKYATGKHILGNKPAALYPPVLPGNLMNVEAARDSRVGFRYKPMLSQEEIIGFRALSDFIDNAPATIAPNPLLSPLLPLLPNLAELTTSNQYQTLKRYFLNISDENVQYAKITTGQRNVLGLTSNGDFAIKEMMRQGMMIDVDHASEKSVDSILIIATRNDYPVNSGHNGLRGNGDNEKTRTVRQLETISTIGGMFGMGWENQTPHQFNENYSNHLRIMGNKNTTFGSDIDGYAATPQKVAPPVGRRSTIPGEPNIVTAQETADYINRQVKYTGENALQLCTMNGSPKTWNYNTDGMAHIGLAPDFFEALKKDNMPIEKINQLFLSAEYFAQMWEKCLRRAPLVER